MNRIALLSTDKIWPCVLASEYPEIYFDLFSTNDHRCNYLFMDMALKHCLYQNLKQYDLICIEIGPIRNCAPVTNNFDIKESMWITHTKKNYEPSKSINKELRNVLYHKSKVEFADSDIDMSYYAKLFIISLYKQSKNIPIKFFSMNAYMGDNIGIEDMLENDMQVVNKLKGFIL